MRAAHLDWLLLPDEATPQKLINLMAGTSLPHDFDTLPPSEQQRALDRLGLTAQRGWYYEEFGQKVQGMMRDGGPMSDFRGMLRRFDDCALQYEYHTLGREDRVELPYMALLANMTPADLGIYAKRGSALWSDGVWARFVFVTPPHDEGKRDRFPPGERTIPRALVSPLVDWHHRLGLPEIELEPQASGDYILRRGLLPQHPCTFGAGVYEAMLRYNDCLLDLLATFNTTDLDGNYSRFPEKALRVAMLLASLENDGLIEMHHWARAQEIAERWRYDLHALYDQVNEGQPSESETFEEKICDLVRRFGSPTAREVTQYVHGLNSPEAVELMDKLAEVGVLEKFKSGRTFRYRFPLLPEV